MSTPTEPGGTGHGSVDADYRALREGTGAYHLARDFLAVSGPDAADYLQGQCSQDVAALADGEVADALLLAPDGKLVALVRLQRVVDDRFIVDTAGGYGETALARLRRFKLRSKVDLERLDWACVALRGTGVAAALGQAVDGAATAKLGGFPGVRALPVSWNGTTGVDLVGPDPERAVPGTARWCGAGGWEALRVEAGIPEMGRELDERTIAAEADLLARTVSFTKGCYTGQELLARLDARGNRVARHLAGVVLDPATAPDPAAVAGAEVFAGAPGKAVGRCTSAAWCPGVGRLAALAYLHRSVPVPGPLTLEVTEGDRIRTVAAEARPLPLC
ncbi:MAG: YgfZ/GcvT domain-containing protein [Acidimicrobiales bacterium]